MLIKASAQNWNVLKEPCCSGGGHCEKTTDSLLKQKEIPNGVSFCFGRKEPVCESKPLLVYVLFCCKVFFHFNGRFAT